MQPFESETVDATAVVEPLSPESNQIINNIICLEIWVCFDGCTSSETEPGTPIQFSNDLLPEHCPDFNDNIYSWPVVTGKDSRFKCARLSGALSVLDEFNKIIGNLRTLSSFANDLG